MEITIRPAVESEAEAILCLTQTAFAAHGNLDPPSGVFQETVDTVLQAMAEGTVYVAVRGADLVGVVRVRALAELPALYCGRLAVRASAQGQGIGTALMARVERQARAEGYPAVVVGVRVQLPGNIRFFQRLGYQVYAEHSHPGYDRPTYVRLRKDLGTMRDAELRAMGTSGQPDSASAT